MDTSVIVALISELVTIAATSATTAYILCHLIDEYGKLVKSEIYRYVALIELIPEVESEEVING